MGSIPRAVLCLLTLFSAGALSTLHAAEWPMLRHTTYVAILGERGQEMQFSLRSSQRAPRYEEELRYQLIGPDSEPLAVGHVPLGAQATVAARLQEAGLCVFE